MDVEVTIPDKKEDKDSKPAFFELFCMGSKLFPRTFKTFLDAYRMTSYCSVTAESLLVYLSPAKQPYRLRLKKFSRGSLRQVMTAWASYCYSDTNFTR